VIQGAGSCPAPCFETSVTDGGVAVVAVVVAVVAEVVGTAAPESCSAGCVKTEAVEVAALAHLLEAS
jgi:hypothetical protein